MDVFSYNSDISPLKKEYFSGSSLSDREQSMLVSKYKTSTDAAIESQLNTQKEMIQMQTQALQFENAKLSLEDTRRKIKNQLEMEELLPRIQPVIQGLISDPNTDAATGTLAVEKLRLELSPYTIKNPSLNAFFDNASNAFKVKATDQTLIREAALNAAKGGDTRAAQDIMGYKNASDAISRLAQSEQEIAASKTRQEQQKLQQEKAGELGVAQTKAQLSSLNKQVETILGMKPQSGNLPAEGGGQFGASPSGTTAPTYTPQQKKTLEIMLKRMNPSLRNKDMKDEPFDKLYNDALEGSYIQIDDLINGVATESNISKKSQ
jgi:hypothetical protein